MPINAEMNQQLGFRRWCLPHLLVGARILFSLLVFQLVFFCFAGFPSFFLECVCVTGHACRNQYELIGAMALYCTADHVFILCFLFLRHHSFR